MKLILRGDGDSSSGLGHLYRLAALASMLDGCAPCILVTRTAPAPGIFPAGTRTVLIPHSVSLNAEPAWLHETLPSSSHRILCDGYHFATAYQQQLRKLGYWVAYIDDLVNGEYVADLVINHAAGVSAEDYDAGKHTKLALGARFAILRPAFLGATRAAHPAGPSDRAFVCFGGADPSDLSLKVAKGMLQIPSITEIHLVVGAAYPHREIFELAEKFPKVHVHRDVNENMLLGIIRSCGFAFVPSSGILYEVCAAGVPAITGYYTANQKYIWKGCVEAGVAYDSGDISRFDPLAFRDKVTDFLRKGNFETYATAQRKMFSPGIRNRHRALFGDLNLRDAVPTDLERVYEWSNDPVTRANSYSSAAISPDEHAAWYNRKMSDTRAMMLVAEVCGEPAGLVRYELKEGHGVAGVMVASEFRGVNLAEKMLARSAAGWFSRFSVPLHAYIKKENTASVRAFVKAGYSLLREERVNGCPSYVYQLEEKDVRKG